MSPFVFVKPCNYSSMKPTIFQAFFSSCRVLRLTRRLTSGRSLLESLHRRFGGGGNSDVDVDLAIVMVILRTLRTSGRSLLESLPRRVGGGGGVTIFLRMIMMMMMMSVRVR